MYIPTIYLVGVPDDHLDSCRRTMSYVRRTTSYNTDVAHDVVRHARTTSYPYDVVARTTSQPYDVVCLYDIVGLTYDIVCCHRIRHRMF
jgi:hypothetical protein